jgi:hypothetical protein
LIISSKKISTESTDIAAAEAMCKVARIAIAAGQKKLSRSLTLAMSQR